MKGTVLLFCAITIAQAAQPQLTISGKVCNCNPGEALSICSKNGSDNELIAHENCNQFYKCTHGRPVPYFCPSTTQYNPIAEICDWPENVECGERPIVSPGSGEESEDCSQENNNNQDNGGQDNGTGGSCNCNPEEAPALCAADESDGVLVTHQNCNQFYKCDNGIPVTLNCPPGLLYNPYTEQCDWPHNVDCGDRPIIEIEGGGDNGGDIDCEDSENNGNGDGNGESGNGDTGGTCNCNPGEAPGICATDDSDGVLVAHENCNQFYKCANGVPVALFCIENLVYNPYTEQCDWPQNVDCGERPIVEVDGGESNGGDEDCDESGNGNGESGSEGGNGDNGGGDNGGTCNCNPEDASGICSADGSDGILVAHENCNQFYKCEHGTTATMTCPAGLVYNPYIECCDWPANVNCGDKPIVEIEGGGNGDSGSGGGNGDNGSGGGSDGGNSNEENGGTCNCNPEDAPGICSLDSSDGTLVAHENCNQFYKCEHGTPATMTCPAGLVYNPYIECCDWPANVNCGDKPIVEIEGGGNGDSGSGGGNGDNGSGGGSEGGNSNEDNGGTCNCNPEDAPGICSLDGSDGTLVAHENCNQFYKCDHGTPVTMTCPAGLVYNPFIECCDWPANVNCGDKPIIEIEGGGSEDNGSGGGNGDNGSGGGSEGGNSNEDNGGSCNCNPEDAPGICSAGGSDGTLVAHENCNQFYKCEHGTPATMTCPAGLVYNPYIECCDWPANVNCGDKPIVEIEGGGNGDSGSGGGNGDNGSGGGSDGGSSNEDNGGTCNCNPEDAPGICSLDSSDGTLVAHENCNQFYKCEHGTPATMTCPAGLVYNPYIECCDWPANVNCGDKPIVEIEGGGNGDSGSGGGNGDNGSGGGSEGGSSNEDNGGTCNCNPEDAPGICSLDSSDGTLVAHENCNQFYKCFYGKPVTITCPVGLVYNPYTEYCDWSANVNCGDKPIVEIEGGGNEDSGSESGNGENGSGGGSDGDNSNEENGGTCNCNPEDAPGICSLDGSDGTLVAHENCNQFYKCDHGTPVTMTCPAGLVYNPYIECCDWPANVNCGDKPIIEIDGGGSEDNGSGGGNGDNGSDGESDGGNSNEDNEGTCNCNPEDAPGICAAEGSSGVLVAHENCNQFYKCSNGKPVAMFCPAGLLYNPYTEYCNWPANVNCGDKPIVEIEGNGNGDNDNGGTCNCNPKDAAGICAADGSNGALVAHENCNLFYKCANGVPVALYCNDNLLYNPLTEQCDWPENVDCGDRPIVEIESEEDSEDTDNGGGTCNCNPDEAPEICAASDSDGVLVAHENCNQFYKCANGVPVALSCNDNLLYNPYTKQCDWSDNVDCGDRLIVETEVKEDSEGTDNDNADGTCNCNPGEATGICGASGSDGVFIAHENCNQFYQCAHGTPVPKFCSGSLVYNPYTQRCDWPHSVDCGDRPIVENEGGSEDNGDTDNGGTDNGGGDNGGDNESTCNCNPDEAPSICNTTGSDGTLVAHGNCNQFYRCAHGVPVAMFCSGNLLYNPYTQRCDWPSLVECGNRPIVEFEVGGENDGDNGSGSGDGDGSDDGDTCDPSQAPEICSASGSDGIMVSHENCDQFYVCYHGVPLAMDCPSNLLYNSNTKNCDWPHNVDCGDRVVPEPDSGGSDGPCACNAKEAPSICAGSGSYGKLIAHEYCSRYYTCFGGVPVARSCPQSLFYDPHTEQCLWPALVSCEGRIITHSSANKHMQARRGLL